MLADFYTKALQGSLLNLFKDVIMGYKHISDLMTPVNLLFKESVGNNNDISVNRRRMSKK